MNTTHTLGGGARHTRPELIVEGGLIAAAGVLAIAFPLVVGWTAVVVAGWALLGVGIVRATSAARRPRDERLGAFAAAAVTIAAGALMLWSPLTGAVSGSLLVAAWLAADGLMGVAEAVRRHRTGLRGWLLVSAVALTQGLLAAVMIASAAFAPGVALGLVLGVSLVALGLALVALGADVAEAPAPR